MLLCLRGVEQDRIGRELRGSEGRTREREKREEFKEA